VTGIGDHIGDHTRHEPPRLFKAAFVIHDEPEPSLGQALGGIPVAL
jgi:hypothetical protein